MLCYNDQLDFRYNEGEHKYTVSSLVEDKVWTTPKPVTGVTTICSIMNKEALVFWAAKTAAYYFRDNITDLKNKVALAEEAKRAHLEVANAGKRAGSMGHELVEQLMLGKTTEPPEDEVLLKQYKSIKDAFKHWRSDFDISPLASETAVYSQKYDYAGTFDLAFELNDKVWLIDFKTSNSSYYNPDGIYAENFAQLGAYMIAAEEMLNVKIDECAIVNIPKDGGDYKMRSLSDLNLSKTDAKLYFLACLDLYNKHKTFQWRLNQ